MTRREFAAGAAAFGVSGSVLQALAASEERPWLGLLLHMTDNMWSDYSVPAFRRDAKKLVRGGGINPSLNFDAENFRRKR